jgi:outer membrane protein OmpA-like peptidoglycan-associated protein
LFATNSSLLNKQDEVIIKDFSEYLKTNPNLNVLIAGHTDNSGNTQDNAALSEARAHSVYNFLTSCGISSSRLSFKGYGESKPIADNSTEVGKSQNRRTEFVIVSK